MKEKRFGILRSGMALVLVLCIFAGFVPSVAFAAEVEPIKYVSLGDSMTNGLALGGGYDSTGHCGYLEIDKFSYPYYFQKHLAKMNGWNGEDSLLTKYADLTQLATSGMRAEDLNYILNLGTEDALACDEWAQSELLAHRWSDPDVANVYQMSVANADVITMAVGNSNFGVYMMDVINSAMDKGRDDISFDHCTLNNALELLQLDTEMKTMVKDAYTEIMAYLSAYLPAELADTLADRASYVLASYLVNFEGALDRIIELNPDAEIVIVGLINTVSYFDMDITYQGETKHMDMADLLDLLLNPLNLYLATLPTLKQAQGDYSEATFYYAELDRIETLSLTYKDAYQEEENLIRNRFVSDIVGDGNGMIWSVLKDNGKELKNISLDDVVEYEAYVYGADGKNDENAQIQGLLAYNANETRAAKTASVVTYLVFENTILDALEKPVYVNLDEIVIPEDDNQGVMGIIIANLGDALAETPILNKAVADNLEKVATAYVNAVVVPTLPPMDDDETAAALRGAIEAAMESDEVIALTTAYVMPTAMTDDLNSESTLSGLLCLYGRTSLSNGMSSHPNRNDHVNMAAEVIAAYGNHTAQDEVTEQTGVTLTKVYKLLKKYGPEIAATQPQAISAKIPMDDNFKYVAIGDTSAVSKSYVDGVAAALNEDAAKNGVGPIEVVNLAKNDNTVADELANLSDVAGADLITIGFSNVTFLSKTLQNKVVIDWASCVGEENVHYVEELLVTIDETLEGSGMPAQFKDYVKNLLEAYAYSAAEYIFGMPKLIEAIQEVNPDAVIVIVGMYNPLKGVEISLDAQSSLGFGDYIDYLVDIVAAQGFAYAVSTDNVIYVDAREVETNSINSKLDMMGMLTLLTKIQNMYPTENGHAYIKDQIMKALILTYGLLGDADGNGKIQTNDAKLILQHIVRMPVQLDLSVCDVDGNGKIQTNDAKLILQYIVKIIPQFPAEKK